jgi:large subunit ribosomal protein L7A
MHRLQDAKKKTIGFKQSLKAVERGQALVVYVAKDGEDKIRLSILELCRQQEVPVVEVATMLELGKACGIQVGASVAALLDSGDFR